MFRKQLGIIVWIRSGEATDSSAPFGVESCGRHGIVGSGEHVADGDSSRVPRSAREAIVTDMRIEQLDRDRLSEARKLVWRCFPRQTVCERFSFWAIAHHRSPYMRRLMAWAGVADFLDFWGAIDRQTGRLLGTTGLYECTCDATEAVWLAWFCVEPEARRSGIGSQLLDFSIEQAKRTERQYLRLYTSDRSTEAAAQLLYESRGLKTVERKRRLFYSIIYRQLRLDSAGDGYGAE